MLNERGFHSKAGKPVNIMMVARVREHYHLKPRYERFRERGLLTLDEIAQVLGISTATAKQWRLAGLLRAHPAKWNAQRMRRVAEDVSLALEGLLPVPAGTPAHWRPMHGDYVPWNLREDPRGQLWLIDWEDARWGPPLADLVRYVVAYHSLGWRSPDRIATVVRRTVGAESLEALLEVATFWLSHENLQPGEHQGNFDPRESEGLCTRGTGGRRFPRSGIGSCREDTDE